VFKLIYKKLVRITLAILLALQSSSFALYSQTQYAHAACDNSDVICLPPTLKVLKEVTNNDGGRLEPSDFTIRINGIPAKLGAIYTMAVGESYTITEDSVVGYEQVSTVCKDNDSAVVLSEPVVLLSGQNATCTVTNDDVAPVLTVIKRVINDNGGTLSGNDFGVKLNGDPIAFDHVKSVYKKVFTFSAGIEQTLTEPDTAGYTEGNWVCNNDRTSETTTITFALLVGDFVTCEITNDDQPATIFVTKTIVGDTTNKYDFSIDYFSASANNPTHETFSLGDLETTGEVAKFEVNAGTATVTEAPNPTVWSTTASCVNGDAEAWDFAPTNTVTLSTNLGESFFCRFINIEMPKPPVEEPKDPPVIQPITIVAGVVAPKTPKLSDTGVSTIGAMAILALVLSTIILTMIPPRQMR
jgi:large repetitive protein